MPDRGSVRRGLAAAILVGLLAANAPVSTAGEEPTILPAYTISTESAAPPTRFEAFDASGVSVFDLDGDGVSEILAHNDNNHAYVFDGGTGALVAELVTNHPDRWDARELNGVSVGDVNGNGAPDVVVANSVGWVTAFEARPPASPTDRIAFDELWATFLDPTKMDPAFFANRSSLIESWDGFPGLDGAAYLADVDGDGADEAFAQTDNVPSHFGLRANGSVRWWNDRSDGNGNPVAGDVDGDGDLEAVFATDGGRVFVYDAATGRERCVFDAKAHGAMPASVSVAPTLVDLDGDGALEFAFGARQAVDDGTEDWMTRQHARYFAVKADCGLLWTSTFEWGNPHVYMRPAAADVTGDGHPDLVIQDWNTIGHKPGNWESTGPSNLFALDGRNGELVWRLALDTFWSNKDVAVADVIGDGAPEILAVAPRGSEDGVTLVSLAGDIVGFVGVGDGWSVSRGPAVADLDGDGALEILVPVHRDSDHCERENLDVGCREGAIRVYHTGKESAPVWDGVFVYNHAHDVLREPRAAETVRVNVTQLDAPIGTLALSIDSGNASAAYAKRVGTTEWVPLARDGDSRFEAALAPRNNEEFKVRVTLEDGRVAFGALRWEGRGDGRLDGLVATPGGDPIPDATVTVKRDGNEVETLRANESGAFRFEGPPGIYVLTASAGGRETLTVEAPVRPGEASSVTLRLSDDRGFALPQFAVPGLALAGALLVGGVVALASGVRRHGRDP